MKHETESRDYSETGRENADNSEALFAAYPVGAHARYDGECDYNCIVIMILQKYHNYAVGI